MPLCPRPNGVAEFIVSAYIKVPSGIKISDATLYLDKVARQYDVIFHNFIAAIGYGVGELAGAGQSRIQIVNTELPSSYVLCNSEFCEGLVDPISHSKIEFDWDGMGRSSNQHITYFRVKDVPPYKDGKGMDWESLVKADQQNITSIYSPWVWEGIARRAHLSLKEWLDDHYFVIPEREQAVFCKSIGRQTNCLYSGQQANSIDDLLKSDKRVRALLKESTWKMSKKVDGDWIIARILFDPTPYCKYAKPKTDFFTH